MFLFDSVETIRNVKSPDEWKYGIPIVPITIFDFQKFAL